MSEEGRKPRFEESGYSGSGADEQNIRKLISGVEERLHESIKAESLEGLNSFERKMVHRHFDHNPDFETRTYRNGDKFTLSIYPVDNIKKFAKDKSQELLDTGTETCDLPPMGSYERYIVHAAVQDISGVETASQGEGPERHVQISSKKRFGRGLKKIVKRIKLF